MPFTDIDRIKRDIRESVVPYFGDKDIEQYLSDNDGDVRKTTYQLLLIKSEDTSIKVSGLNTADTSKYFLRLASNYRPNHGGILR